MQFQSDLLQADVELSKYNETTALGAAYLAGLATGFWNRSKKSNHYGQKRRPIHLKWTKKRDRLYSGWKKAVEAARVFKL